jgi:hypothetical protein
MQKQSEIQASGIPTGTVFVLKEQVGEELQLVGYVIENAAAKFKPAYNVVVVNDAGEAVASDFIIDSNKAGDLLLKHKTPETVKLEDGTEKTYEYSIIGKLWEALSKAGNRYYRGKGMRGSFEGRTFRMFLNDGKFGSAPKTGTNG